MHQLSILQPPYKSVSVRFLFACILLFSVMWSCEKGAPASDADKDKYFDAVFKHAENKRDESIGYIDSVFNAYPEPRIKDIYRKYIFLWFAHAEVKKDYATGMKYADSAIWIMQTHLESHEDSSLYARAFFLKGDIYLSQKKYTDAVINYYKGREIIQKNADSCSVAEYNNRLAIVAYKQKNYELAITYFHQTLSDYSHCKDQYSISNQQRNLNNIGLCFDQLGKSDSALHYFNKGIQLIESHKNDFPGEIYVETALAVIYGNIGDIYYKNGNTSQAEKLYQESILINVRKNHENRDAQFTQMKLAKLFLETHRLKEAGRLLQSVRLSLDTLRHEAAELRWWPLQQQYYETTHQTDKAYQLFKDYIKVRDSINTNVQLYHLDINKEFEDNKQQYEYSLLKKDNELKSIYLLIAILFSAMSVAILFMGLNNRRLSKLNEKKLIEAKNKAEKAAIAKQEFLSNMSHEIRTPMNAVVGMTHLLLRENPKPEQEENLRTLKFASENLMALLNDILDFNKIDAGKMRWNTDDFNLANLIHGIRSGHEISATKKKIELSVEIDPKIPDMIVGDPVRLTQVLNNLLSNAIKFTMKGWVKLTINLESIQDKNVFVRFIVSDSGIGIDASEQKNIFDSFTQASAGTARQFGGTGLGLAITRKLLELQNSSIELKSEKGKGSTFSFVLSFLKSEKQETDDKRQWYGQPIINNADLDGYRVLIVDDNQMNIKVVDRIIRHWGINTERASSGTEALNKLKETYFDVILMDLHMPFLSGYETCHMIRTQPEFRHSNVPIIALTADIMSESSEKAILGGMNDYLSKPFSPEELYKKLSHYLRAGDPG